MSNEFKDLAQINGPESQRSAKGKEEVGNLTLQLARSLFGGFRFEIVDNFFHEMVTLNDIPKSAAPRLCLDIKSQQAIDGEMKWSRKFLMENIFQSRVHNAKKPSRHTIRCKYEQI
ncbi:CLUMA_CG005056, isoform A [Clunio marinus]|uniref:CLUMA_CG005056, isoform A n=1 Tax=Clunio marinus TaxID=568069 RepID=A0A1J1HTJ8_9DIPT|nr:CLUMA_CG005056, isoform A [Clunio marinus]